MKLDFLSLASLDLYRPLNPSFKEFRLLTVLRGCGDDPLHCILSSNNLQPDSTVRYATISYCWGDASHRGQIFVNSCAMNVPASAEKAIRRVRSSEAHQVIWIDAVCINQSDVKERSSQVTMMGLIYKRAKVNYIYLGEDKKCVAEDVAMALRRIVTRVERIVGPLERGRQRRLLVKMMDIRHAHLQLWESARSACGDDLNITKRLFMLPWFQRLWVVQEAALALQNICLWGAHSFELTDVLLTAGLVHLWKLRGEVYRLPGFGEQDYVRAESTRDLGIVVEKDYQAPGVLLNLFGNGRYIMQRGATDSRDRVFGMLELSSYYMAPANVSKLLKPNYEKAVEHVFRDATRYMLWEYLRLRKNRNAVVYVLEYINHKSEEDMLLRNRPSWTMMLDKIRQLGEDSVHFGDGDTAGIKSTDDRSNDCIDMSPADPNVLSLWGCHVDDVAWPTGQATFTSYMLEHHRTMSKACNFVLHHLKNNYPYKLFPGLDITLLVRDILTAGRNLGFAHREEKKEAFESFQLHLNHKTSVPRPDFLPEDEARPDLPVASSPSRHFVTLLRFALLDRKFFTTYAGTLGLGPKIMQPGDRLVVFRGLPHPLILRPAGNQNYLVGAAYVHGLMHGEVFDMDLPFSWIHLI